MYKKLSIVLIALFLMVAAAAPSLAGSTGIPPKKQTALGLYVTAGEAYARWQAAPEKTVILDVRTQEEYIFVGHAPMAHNIPVMFLNPIRENISMKPNTDFVSRVKTRVGEDATILVMCRSGARSAMAVNKLAKAGFKDVYNIVDGFEGGKVKNPASYYHGKRMVNGWKNADAPWTYGLDRALVYRP